MDHGTIFVADLQHFKRFLNHFHNHFLYELLHLLEINNLLMIESIMCILMQIQPQEKKLNVRDFFQVFPVPVDALFPKYIYVSSSKACNVTNHLHINKATKASDLLSNFWVILFSLNFCNEV